MGDHPRIGFFILVTGAAGLALAAAILVFAIGASLLH